MKAQGENILCVIFSGYYDLAIWSATDSFKSKFFNEPFPSQQPVWNVIENFEGIFEGILLKTYFC